MVKCLNIDTAIISNISLFDIFGMSNGDMAMIFMGLATRQIGPRDLGLIIVPADDIETATTIKQEKLKELVERIMGIG